MARRRKERKDAIIASLFPIFTPPFPPSPPPFSRKRESRGLRTPLERGRPAGGAALARVTLILAFSHREKGSADCCLYLISDGGLGCNRLDFRFRGNDGRRGREWWALSG